MRSFVGCRYRSNMPRIILILGMFEHALSEASSVIKSPDTTVHQDGSMTITVQTIDLIAIDPTIRSGRPYILGTTVTISDVAIAKLYHDKDVDGIADWYGLSLPQVYAALAYYYEHKEDIDLEIRQQISRAQMLKEHRVGSRA